MKNILLILLTLILSNSLLAQDHVFIKEHLRIWFIEDLTKPPVFPGQADPNKTFINENPNHAFWTSPEHAQAAKFIKRLIEPINQQEGNTSRRDRILQRTIRAILQISGKPVELYLFNDNSMNIDPGWRDYSHCGGWVNKQFAAPCGQCRNTVPSISGTIGVGSGYLNERRNDLFGDEAFIHELVMTQLDFGFEPNFPRELEEPIANVRKNNSLISSKNYATKRGIALAFSLYYHSKCILPEVPGAPPVIEAPFYEGKKVLDWFRRDQVILLNSLGDCNAPNSRIPQQFCLAQLLSQDGIAIDLSQRKFNFSVRSLSARGLLHNSVVQANIFCEYMRQNNSMAPLSLFSNAIQSALQEKLIAKDESDIFRLLFKHLTILSKNSRAEGEYLLLAIMDYYTGLKITNKKDLVYAIGSYSSWAGEGLTGNLNVYFEAYRSPLLVVHNGEGRGSFNRQNLNRFVREMLPPPNQPNNGRTGRKRN